jgi:hypothetical protein
VNDIDPTALLAEAPMPPGYKLSVRPQREHKYRSLWSVVVSDESGSRIHGRAYYNLAAGIRAAQRWAWDRASVPMTVTTDDEGYITSMEPTDA